MPFATYRQCIVDLNVFKGVNKFVEEPALTYTSGPFY